MPRSSRVKSLVPWRPISACMTGCIAVVSFFLTAILAGPSIGGQTAGEELLKTSSLYFITACITWATLRKPASIEHIASPLQNERSQNAEGQDTDRQTGDHRAELGTLVKYFYYYYHIIVMTGACLTNIRTLCAKKMCRNTSCLIENARKF